jgi:nucleoside-triphosphatase THEP1
MAQKPTLKALHRLWADCVKARAQYRSEYSGKEGCLHAHHIHGKSNYRLRFELRNGVCITGGEHKFIAHHSGRSAKFKRWAMDLRQLWDAEVEILERQLGSTDLFLVEIYLKQQLKKFKENL